MESADVFFTRTFYWFASAILQATGASLWLALQNGGSCVSSLFVLSSFSINAWVWDTQLAAASEGLRGPYKMFKAVSLTQTDCFMKYIIHFQSSLVFFLHNSLLPWAHWDKTCYSKCSVLFLRCFYVKLNIFLPMGNLLISRQKNQSGCKKTKVYLAGMHTYMCSMWISMNI